MALARITNIPRVHYVIYPKRGEEMTPSNVEKHFSVITHTLIDLHYALVSSGLACEHRRISGFCFTPPKNTKAKKKAGNPSVFAG